MADILYEVEQIVGKKITNKRRVLYLVRWKGFSSEHDSWEPANNLDSCRNLLASYNSNVNLPVIIEDSPESIKNKKVASPGKQVKGDNKATKNMSKGNLTSHTSSPSIVGSGKKRGRKSLKENQMKKQSPSKGTQTALISGAHKKLSFPQEKSSLLKSLRKAENSNMNLNCAHQDINIKSGSLNDKDNLSLDEPLKRKFRKRKHPETEQNFPNHSETGPSQLGPSHAKKLKYVKHKVGESSRHVQTDNDKQKTDDQSGLITEEVVDLTQNDGNSNDNNNIDNGVHEEIEISDEEDVVDDDDDNVLYSLNSDCDVMNVDMPEDGESKLKKDHTKMAKMDNDNSKLSVIAKADIKANAAVDTFKPGPGRKKKRMTLMDSAKSSKTWLNKSAPLRSETPPPTYTSMKDVLNNPINPDPSKPSGNSLPDPVSPEASETYLADVPSSFPVPAEEPVTEEPLSPGSLLYKSLLDSLPDQLQPLHKGSKKGKGDNSRGLLGKSLFGPSGKTVVERRTSVRSTECAFRYKQIVVKKCSRYTQIWLNTTTVMNNALNPMVIQEIVSALNSAKYDDSRLVLFSGLGNVFCSGTDLHYLVSGDRAVAARQMAEKIRELTKTFITFPKPIIAAVSGAAVGLGVAILALCDVVYASDKASFHMPYSQLSQTPEACSSFTLPLTLGLPSANELLYGGRKITAMEAYQLGLVSQVFWPTLMMQEIIPRAQNMASCSAKALEATKLLVRSHHRTKMELTNETECNLLLESWFSVECQQAIEAYIGDEKNFSF